MIGIVIALIMRGGFIAAGAALIENFSWVFYLFGALLFVLAYQQLKGGHGGNAADNMFVRVARRILPVHDDFDGDKLHRQDRAASASSRRCCSASSRSASSTSSSRSTRSPRSTA